LLSKRAWIADDAVSAGDVIDDGLFKQVVTGEEFTTDRKNTTHATGRLDIPVAFSSNLLPKVKDDSDGVYNRSLIIQMKVERTEEETAGRPEIDKIVQAEELAGVFAWSLEGLARILARGRFLSSDSMADANEDFKAANNPVAAWIKAALEIAPQFMVDRRDIYASFKGWFIAEYGERLAVPPPNTVTRQVKARLPIEDYESHGNRLMVGVMMTPDGLVFRAQCHSTITENAGPGIRRRVNKVLPMKNDCVLHPGQGGPTGA
jgi:putative DNA primase/helicase